MKKLLVMAMVLYSTVATAQYWRGIGRGVVGPNGVQTLYGDSVSDRLLAGGTFLHILNESDTVLAFGQAAWNGFRWDSLATRIQAYGGGESAQQTFWFLRFQGRLYSCGGYLFLDENGQVNSSFARLNEVNQKWEALECTNPYPGSGLKTLVPKDPQNTLYATGYSGTVCGYPESCVFRYDGTAFYPWPPYDLIPGGSENQVGSVFEFRGKTYMTCDVPDPTGPGYVSFIRWTGIAWEHVPGWNTLSPIKDISIRNDTMYVGGTFTLATGGPGNLVAAFDGEHWSDMGSGLTYPIVPMSGVVWDLEWFHGELLACGRFTQAGNADCTGLAKWNGQQWCTLPGEFLHPFGTSDAALYKMAIWRDSLYVCGGFGTIDGDTIKQVAQWIGGDAVGNCSTVGIAGHASGDPGHDGLKVIPLPTEASWAVHFPKNGPWIVEVYDAMGRKVTTLQSIGTSVDLDLRGASSGMYLLRAVNSKGDLRSAKVVRP